MIGFTIVTISCTPSADGCNVCAISFLSPLVEAVALKYLFIPMQSPGWSQEAQEAAEARQAKIEAHAAAAAAAQVSPQAITPMEERKLIPSWN